MGFKSSKDETESDGKTDREVKDDKNNTRTKTQDKKMPKKKRLNPLERQVMAKLLWW